MKTRFSGLDLAVILRELQPLVGMRINQIYDIDKKTYLLKLQRTEEKAVLLIESGARIHSTNSVWPKNDAPSGFTMKLRKHLKNKRLEALYQLGRDRVVVMQFGTGEVAHFVVIELYDRGNILLTDHEHVILGILRPRVQDENTKMLVRETYDLLAENKTTKEGVDDEDPVVSNETVSAALEKASPTDNLKKILLPHCNYGPAVLEHVLLKHELTGNKKKRDLPANVECLLVQVLAEARDFLANEKPKGFITQKIEKTVTSSSDQQQQQEIRSNLEFHPFKFRQHEKADAVKEFDTFVAAVDEFFSQLESQKIDMKVVQQEKQALKKLDNIKKDHDQRLHQLEQDQQRDKLHGELIEINCEIVDKALNTIRTAIANQIDWKDIESIVEEAAGVGDPTLGRIRKLDFQKNHFIMALSDPYVDSDDSDVEDQDQEVELDIDLTAQANARKYYDKKKSAALKERKTLQSHGVAMKSAEKKTKQTLREVAVSANITKARKTYWFEKFYWFISSENYLVIGGRDGQQNELIVKRYMASGDLYVHADLHGASSVIIKNPSGKPVPPKTLNEAGTMAVCFSAAWESKVVTSAWWVESSQVSKSAPTGEYLTTGSFMIRGKKNYLPPSHLVLGFGILFKLGDDSLERHKNERSVRNLHEEGEAVEAAGDGDRPELQEQSSIEVEDDVEIKVEDDGEEEETEEPAQSSTKLEPVVENPEAETEKPTSEKEKSDSAEEDVKEETVEFPDTTLEMNFATGGKGLEFKAQTSVVSNSSVGAGDEAEANGGQQIGFVSKGGPSASKKKKGGGQASGQASKQDGGAEKQQQQQVQNKRGKKGKQKKIREKYKDQDDEEKELRMQLLHQAQKEDGKRAKKKAKEQQMKADKEAKMARMQKIKSGQHQGGQHPQQKERVFVQKSEMTAEDVEADETEVDGVTAIRVSDEVDMLDALTGIPHAEDELLFAMAVIGPYNAMTNYKYKVKVTPGTAKRGKAAKTTLSVFLADKLATTREKDLLKSLKDQDVSRNFPGKVKISAPQLQKTKAKAKKR